MTPSKRKARMGWDAWDARIRSIKGCGDAVCKGCEIESRKLRADREALIAEVERLLGDRDGWKKAYDQARDHHRDLETEIKSLKASFAVYSNPCYPDAD